MKPIIAAALAAVSLVIAPAASAHLVAKAPKNAPLAQRERVQIRNLAHARGVVAWASHRRALLASPAVKREIRWARKAVVWIAAELAQTRRALRPPLGHLAGWRCITTGDGHPGQAHEGNGYNGRYTGRLGMTTPWAGHRPSTGDWVTVSEAEVYGIAESVASTHSWAYSWMAGQWPETFPPCAGYFG